MRANLISALLLAAALAAAPAAAAPDKTLGMALMTAMVDEDGNLESGIGVVSVERTGNANYQLFFARDIRDCSHAAMVAGHTGHAGFASSALLPQMSGPWGLRVVTRTPDSNDTDLPFTAIVVCAK